MKDFENLSLEHFSLEMDFNFADQWGVVVGVTIVEQR